MTGNCDQQKAERVLAASFADLVAFSRLLIANPDLLQRLQHRQPLATVGDSAALSGGTGVGYTNYPFYAGLKE